MAGPPVSHLGLAILLQLSLGGCGAPDAPSAPQRPNIIFILADDLGFNDVGFHGSPQIPTPHIDELARTGVVLNNYHVQPVCSPTRASIMSGRHVIHTGIYMPFAQGTALRLNLSYTLLPMYMMKLGYDTYMVGKWHLGQNVLEALPTSRGFRKYFGYWSGAEDYYSHKCKGAYDLADDTRTAFEYRGNYSTYLWTERAVEHIETQDPAKPFFMYLAFQNVHWPLQAPEEFLRRFAKSAGGSPQRTAVCAMASVMDESVGNITAALKRRGLYEKTLIVFSADNGGPTNKNEGTWSSNYPMRGGKNTLWEGGTRAAAVIRGPGIHPALLGGVSYAKIHATDWLRTLVTVAASGDSSWLDRHLPAQEPPFLLGDGLDVWDSLRSGREVRTELLLETHAEGNIMHGHGLIVGDWKLLRAGPTNPANEQGWYPPPGQDPATVKYQLPCDLKKQPPWPGGPACTEDFCLFNITADPCEYEDLASQFPSVVAQLKRRLADFQATATKPITTEGCGCAPVVVQGAWRPCDSPDPAGVVTWAISSHKYPGRPPDDIVELPPTVRPTWGTIVPFSVGCGLVLAAALFGCHSCSRRRGYTRRQLRGPLSAQLHARGVSNDEEELPPCDELAAGCVEEQHEE